MHEGTLPPKETDDSGLELLQFYQMHNIPMIPGIAEAIQDESVVQNYPQLTVPRPEPAPQVTADQLNTQATVPQLIEQETWAYRQTRETAEAIHEKSAVRNYPQLMGPILAPASQATADQLSTQITAPKLREHETWTYSQSKQSQLCSDPCHKL